MSVVTVKTASKTFTLDSCTDLRTLPYYDDIVYINCSGLQWSYLPDPLPNSLQILVADRNRISMLSSMPPMLRSISLSNNKLHTFPNLSHLKNLESADLSLNSIEEIVDIILPPELKILNLQANILKTFTVAQWSEHLVELNLGYNRLTDLNICFDRVNTTCDVKLWYNDFPCQKYNAYTLWFTDDNAEETAALVKRFARFGMKLNAQNTIGQNTIGQNTIGRNTIGQNTIDLTRLLQLDTRIVVKSLYQDAHNVHASSVQNSTNESVQWLIDSGTIDSDAIEYIKHLWRPRRFWYVSEWLEVIRANHLIEMWSLDNTIHSVHGIRYAELVGYMWNVMKDHKDKGEIAQVLRKEVLDADGVCFTGRFTRTLNALSGFVEGVQVGISSKEQMQNRIVTVIAKARKNYGDGTLEYEEAARRDVKDILTEFEVPKEEHDSWLDAI